MSRGRKIWYALIIACARGLLRLSWQTLRVTDVIGEEHLDRLRETNRAGIVAYWHQMHIVVSNYLLRRVRQGDRIGFLISPSVTGEVPTAIARRWGAKVVRGSSSRTGAQALRDLHQALKRDRLLVAINPDGPKGPLHEFKSGAILLSRMTGAAILPMAYAASRCSYWKSWDKFMVPWFFSRVVIAVGEPVQIPKGGGVDELKHWQARMEEAMTATQAAAQAALDT